MITLRQDQNPVRSNVARYASLALIGFHALTSGCSPERRSEASSTASHVPHNHPDCARLAYQRYYQMSCAEFRMRKEEVFSSINTPAIVRNALENPAVREILDVVRVGEKTLDLQKDISDNPRYGDEVRQEVVIVLQWAVAQLQQHLVNELKKSQPNKTWSQVPVKITGSWGPVSGRAISHVLALADEYYQERYGTRLVTYKPITPHETRIGPVMLGLMDSVTQTDVCTRNDPAFPYAALLRTAHFRARTANLSGLDEELSNSYLGATLRFLLVRRSPAHLQQVYSTNRACSGAACREILGNVWHPLDDWRNRSERELTHLLVGVPEERLKAVTAVHTGILARSSVTSRAGVPQVRDRGTP